jgi:hypothetical protein
MSFRFILIINGHKEEWLAPVGDALKRKLKPYLKIWRIGENGVAVLNQDGARMRGLVV